MRAATTRAGLLAVTALLVACGTADGEPGATGGAETPEPVEAAAEAAPEPEALAELDPRTVCGQAQACCRAYAEALPDVAPEFACAGPAEHAGDPDADARCRRMTEGWRETLRLLPDVEPPPECSP